MKTTNTKTMTTTTKKQQQQQNTKHKNKNTNSKENLTERCFVFVSSFLLPNRLLLCKVDTGVGATSTAASAGHARCLVRALCLLLRKVSLHALLQGAGGGGDASSGGLEGAAEVIIQGVKEIKNSALDRSMYHGHGLLQQYYHLLLYVDPLYTSGTGMSVVV